MEPTDIKGAAQGRDRAELTCEGATAPDARPAAELPPLPEAMLSRMLRPRRPPLRGRCSREITEAVKRYLRPLPVEAQARSRELRYRLRLYAELRRAQRLLSGVRPADESPTRPPRRVPLHRLAAPPRGGRGLSLTLAAKAHRLAFAVELTQLVRPAFLAAQSEYRRVLRPLRRRRQAEDEDTRPNAHRASCQTMARQAAQKTFNERARRAIDDGTHLPEDRSTARQGRRVLLPSAAARERLREAVATTGRDCLDWPLDHKPRISLPTEICTALARERRGPLGAASAFGAVLARCGFAAVIRESKAHPA